MTNHEKMMRALIERLAARVATKFEADAPRGWLRDAVRVRDLETEIRKAIRAALRAAKPR